MASDKVIITVAPTGGMASKQANPNLPTQPEEIAESVHKSYKAGAAIAALHARRREMGGPAKNPKRGGAPTPALPPRRPATQPPCNADIYRRINGLIRERC